MTLSELREAIGQVIHDQGYRVRFSQAGLEAVIGYNPERLAATREGLLTGVTHHGEHTVTVSPDIDEWRQCQVLAHELAHVLLHDPFTGPRRLLREMERELEAEGTSYLVLKHYDHGREDWTARYIAGYLQDLSDEAMEAISAATLPTSLNTAFRIVKMIDEYTDRKALKP
jgi:hypothetical protein